MAPRPEPKAFVHVTPPAWPLRAKQTPQCSLPRQSSPWKQLKRKSPALASSPQKNGGKQPGGASSNPQQPCLVSLWQPPTPSLSCLLPRSPRAWMEEGQPEAPALPMLPELPEAPVEMPPGPELLTSEAVFRYERGVPGGIGLVC